MRTDKQNKASRANGTTSDGPVTPEGQPKSADIAEVRKVRAAGHIVLLTNEDEEEYRQLIDDYIVRFLPVDGVELDLVYKMIAATWREKRITGMETALFELEMLRQQEEIEAEYLEISAPARQALALLGTDNIKAAAALLFRYASTARRAYVAALKALRELQGDRFNKRALPGRFPERVPTPTEPLNGEHIGATQSSMPVASSWLVTRSVRRLIPIVNTLRRHPHCKISKFPNEPERAWAVGQSAGASMGLEPV